MTRLSIPDMGNAKDQYIYAVRYRDNTFPAGTPDKRKDQRNQFRQVFQRVVDRHPDDPTYTPLAKIVLADLDRDDGNLARAKEAYRALQRDYPKFTYLNVRAMFSEAQILDSMRQFDQAKAIYRRIMTDFAQTRDPGVPRYVQESNRLYFIVRKDGPDSPQERRERGRRERRR
jgi:tetratricopeptide (TPR) repeat protein